MVSKRKRPRRSSKVSKRTTVKKKVNKKGYTNKYGKRVGPYDRRVSSFPNSYIIYRMVNGERRLCKITRKNGKEYMQVLDNQRKAKSITYAEAKKHFEKLPEHRQEVDKRFRAKNTFNQQEITSSYLTKTGTSRYDVEGLDTPSGKVKQQSQIGKKMGRPEGSIKKKTQKELEDMNQVELEKEIKVLKRVQKEEYGGKNKEIEEMTKAREETLKALKKKARKLVPTPQEKENLKRFNQVKGKIFKETSDESPIENSVMSKDRVQLLTTHEDWNDSNLRKACDEHKEITNLKTNKFIIDSNGDKLILIDNKSAYDMAMVKNALKHLDNKTTTTYFREDYPLVIKDKNLILAIAPRALEDDEEDFRSKEERFKEVFHGLVISEEDYIKITKENTKKDLSKKLGKHYIGGEYPHKSKTKDQMIHDLLYHKEIEGTK